MRFARSCEWQQSSGGGVGWGGVEGVKICQWEEREEEEGRGRGEEFRAAGQRWEREEGRMGKEAE